MTSQLQQCLDIALEKMTYLDRPAQIYRVKKFGSIWLRFEHKPKTEVDGLELELIATVYPYKGRA